MITTRFTIRGKVQGVGFRWWTKGIATELGIFGYVKNLDDGSVEVLAQGSSTAISKLGTRLRQGPPEASVDEIIESAAPSASLSEFVITR